MLRKKFRKKPTASNCRPPTPPPNSASDILEAGRKLFPLEEESEVKSWSFYILQRLYIYLFEPLWSLYETKRSTGEGSSRRPVVSRGQNSNDQLGKVTLSGHATNLLAPLQVRSFLAPYFTTPNFNALFHTPL